MKFNELLQPLDQKTFHHFGGNYWRVQQLTGAAGRRFSVACWEQTNQHDVRQQSRCLPTTDFLTNYFNKMLEDQEEERKSKYSSLNVPIKETGKNKK